MCNINFICGTGRCGTVSVTKLLNNQVNISAAHESYLLPAIPDYIKFNHYINTLVGLTNHFEVAFYFLYYIPYIYKMFPNIKIACLKRDREETYHSFVTKLGKNHHWSNKKDWGNSTYDINSKWDVCFPNYELPREDAIYKYYDDYYNRIDILSKYYPIKTFDMHSVLNTESGQVELFEYFNIIDYNINLNINLN